MDCVSTYTPIDQRGHHLASDLEGELNEQEYFLQFSGEDLPPKSTKAKVIFNGVDLSDGVRGFRLVTPPDITDTIHSESVILGLKDSTIKLTLRYEDDSTPNLFDDWLPTWDQGDLEVDRGEE